MELQKMNKNNIYDLEKEAKTVVFEYYQAKRKVSKFKDKASELGYSIDESTGKIIKHVARLEGKGIKCNSCGLKRTKEGHDGCLGTLIGGVLNACCGHGGSYEGSYVQFADKCSVRGKDADIIIDILKRSSFIEANKIQLLRNRLVEINELILKQGSGHKMVLKLKNEYSKIENIVNKYEKKLAMMYP